MAAFHQDVCKPVFGWIKNETQLVGATEKQTWHDLYGQQVEELITADDNKDRYPYRECRPGRADMFRVDTRTKGRRPLAKNQGKAPSCVGVAGGHGMSFLQEFDAVIRKEPETWLGQVSGEWCYAAARQIAGQLGAGPGASNSWLLQALSQWGVLFEQAYDKYDLSKYDPERAIAWSQQGVPRSLIQLAGKHKLLRAFRVRSVSQWWSLIGAGYPVVLCSNWGGVGLRTTEGIMLRGREPWPHAMLSYWRRMSQRYGRLFGIQNSWGPQWAEESKVDTIVPIDMPWGGFYLMEQEAQWIVQTGEVIAFCDFGGFRKPAANWGGGHNW